MACFLCLPSYLYAQAESKTGFKNCLLFSEHYQKGRRMIRCKDQNRISSAPLTGHCTSVNDNRHFISKSQILGRKDRCHDCLKGGWAFSCLHRVTVWLLSPVPVTQSCYTGSGSRGQRVCWDQAEPFQRCLGFLKGEI